jgi:hypothetical protein
MAINRDIDFKYFIVHPPLSGFIGSRFVAAGEFFPEAIKGYSLSEPRVQKENRNG